MKIIGTFSGVVIASIAMLQPAQAGHRGRVGEAVADLLGVEDRPCLDEPQPAHITARAGLGIFPHLPGTSRAAVRAFTGAAHVFIVVARAITAVRAILAVPAIPAARAFIIPRPAFRRERRFGTGRSRTLDPGFPAIA